MKCVHIVLPDRTGHANSPAAAPRQATRRQNHNIWYPGTIAKSSLTAHLAALLYAIFAIGRKTAAASGQVHLLCVHSYMLTSHGKNCFFYWQSEFLQALLPKFSQSENAARMQAGYPDPDYRSLLEVKS